MACSTCCHTGIAKPRGNTLSRRWRHVGCRWQRALACKVGRFRTWICKWEERTPPGLFCCCHFSCGNGRWNLLPEVSQFSIPFSEKFNHRWFQYMLQSSIIRFSGHCWYLCIYYPEAGNVLRSGGNWSMWSGIWHSQTVYSVKWSDGIKSEDRLFMRRLSEYLHCQHEINSRTMIHVC